MNENPVDKVLKEVKETNDYEKRKKTTRNDVVNKILVNSGLKEPEEIFTPKGQAEFYMGIRPLYYDRSGIWWIWNDADKKWDMTDEVDILNEVDDKTGQDIITPKNRTIIMNSLKQEARKNKPEKIKPTWIQFKDTIIDIMTKEKFPSSPKYFVTNPIPHKMNNPDGNTPNMDRIFEEWVGKDHVKTLYEILAYCTMPDYPIHRLFCLLGAGLNGKGAFLRLVAKFIGKENCTSTELNRLMISRFEITNCWKKLVCLMGETDFHEMKQTAIIKSLTGQDMMTFEHKGKTPFQETNYAKLIIATNNLPTTVDKTVGWYRRWCIIDFPNQFTEAKDILSDIPEKEYEALSTKCAFILNELLQKKCFNNEGSIEERMKKYEDRSNPFDKFWNENIDDNCDPNEFISVKQFKERFEKWCLANRFRQIDERTIGRKMKEKGIEKQRKDMEWVEVKSGGSRPRYWIWFGIKWKD